MTVRTSRLRQRAKESFVWLTPSVMLSQVASMEPDSNNSKLENFLGPVVQPWYQVPGYQYQVLGGGPVLAQGLHD